MISVALLLALAAGCITLAYFCGWAAGDRQRWVERGKLQETLHECDGGQIELRVLHIEKGDVIMVRTTDYLTPQQRDDIEQRVKSCIPGALVAVMDGGVGVEILRGNNETPA